MFVVSCLPSVHLRYGLLQPANKTLTVQHHHAKILKSYGLSNYLEKAVSPATCVGVVSNWCHVSLGKTLMKELFLFFGFSQRSRKSTVVIESIQVHCFHGQVFFFFHLTVGLIAARRFLKVSYYEFPQASASLTRRMSGFTRLLLPSVKDFLIFL